ncbi:MAG: pyroglutamyl-peptidase I [Planctomycetales bacterium]|nr:pyroglutamyl-peptidase I [Planctomycetales bacterium]
MPRTLITAYGPYEEWEENASWLALQELMRDLPPELDVTTRLYPVEFDEVARRLEKDLALGFDLALHLGQAPGNGRIELEAIGINVGIARGKSAEAFALAPDGPPAYLSQAPLVEWAQRLQGEGIPAAVSYHAGTYLCNAALYLTHYLSERHGYGTQAAFLHLPLDTSQTVVTRQDLASLPSVESARAIRLILEDAAVRFTPHDAAAEIE